jgi:hypothetical protein
MKSNTRIETQRQTNLDAQTRERIVMLKKHFVTNLLQIGVRTMLSESLAPRVQRHFQSILNQIKMEEQRNQSLE